MLPESIIGGGSSTAAEPVLPLSRVRLLAALTELFHMFCCMFIRWTDRPVPVMQMFYTGGVACPPDRICSLRNDLGPLEGEATSPSRIRNTGRH